MRVRSSPNTGLIYLVTMTLEQLQPLKKWIALQGDFLAKTLALPVKEREWGGARSGLWSSFARIINNVRPSYIIVENVPGLIVNGMDLILRDLAQLGYNAEWGIVSAADVGAPHLRRRVFITAYLDQQRISEQPRRGKGQSGPGPTDAARDGQIKPMAHADIGDVGAWNGGDPRIEGAIRENRSVESGDNQWASEPSLDRVAYGVPNRVDRIRCLGNAVVPQVAEYVGRKLLEKIALWT